MSSNQIKHSLLRPFLSLVLANFVALFLSTYASAAPAPQWQGYKAIEDVRSLNLPFKDFAENSVYAIFTVGLSDDPSKYEIVDIQKDPRARQTKLKKTDFLSPEGVFAFQIETCRQQNLTRCPVYPSAQQGTAFFNNGKLQTCRHGFHNWLALASKENQKPVDKISPPIVIVASSKKGFDVKYHSGFQNTLKFSTINTDPSLNDIVVSHAPDKSKAKEIYFQQSEYTSLSFSKISPLTDSKRPEASVNDLSRAVLRDSYIVGYPGSSDKLNSPGEKLVINSGKISRKDSDGMLIGSNPTIPGQSGSPLISAEGQILGMNCSGTESASISTTIDSAFLTNLWQQGLEESQQASLVVN